MGPTFENDRPRYRPDRTARTPANRAALSVPPILRPEGPDPESAARAKLRAQRAQRRRKRLIKRGIFAGVAVLAIVGAGVAYAVVTAPPDVLEQTVTDFVMRGDFTNEVSSAGSVEPYSSVVVTPQIDGTIDQVMVSAGSTVAAGDVLFTIKNDALDRAVAEAERGVRQAQNDVDNASNALDQAYAAKKAGVSLPALGSAGAGEGPGIGEDGTAVAANDTGGYDEDAYQAAVRDLQNQVNAAESALEGAQLALEAANEAYAQAVAAAEQRTVTAPAAGSLIAMNAVSGSPVGQGGGDGSQHLVQIADLTRMKVTVQVSEVDIIKIAVGQTATATFSAVPDIALAAEVVSIASTTNAEGGMGYYGGMGGVTYAVELLIPEPDPRLKPGMTASVSIVTESHEGVLLVPAAALQPSSTGGTCVLVQTDPETQETVEREVAVIAKNASLAAVEGGVKEGDPVVVSGYGGDMGFEGGMGGGMAVAGGDMAATADVAAG